MSQKQINSDAVSINEGTVFLRCLFWELFNLLALANLQNKDNNYQIKIAFSALSVFTVWHE